MGIFINRYSLLFIITQLKELVDLLQVEAEAISIHNIYFNFMKAPLELHVYGYIADQGSTSSRQH